MGWWIALGVLILIAIFPIGVSALYDGGGPRVSLIVGPVRVLVYPPKEKKEKTQRKKATKEKVTQSSGQKVEKKQTGGSLQDFFPIVDCVLDFISAFGRKLRVNRLQLKLILAGDDPADLAANYGRTWAAIGNLIPLLENHFVIKNRDVQVICDFLAEETTITARMDLTITVGRIFSLLVVHSVPVIRELLKLMKLRKGGAKA